MIELETTSEERARWSASMIDGRLCRDIDRLLADNEAKAREVAQWRADFKLSQEMQAKLLAEISRLNADNEAKAREIEELRKLGNLSNALWIEAEKEIKELVEPVEYKDYLCFTRGAVRRMEQEKADLEAELARLKARPTSEEVEAAITKLVEAATKAGHLEGVLEYDEAGGGYPREGVYERLDDAEQALSSLVRRLAAQSDGWRPIETAPKDNSKIDIWCVHPVSGGSGVRFTDVFWRVSTSEWGFIADGKKAEFEPLEKDGPIFPAWKPVLWRSLSPPSPSTEEKTR